MMWKWWCNRLPKERSLYVFIFVICLAMLGAIVSKDQPRTASNAGSSADPRYVHEAERNGYKGQEAQDVAAAAKQLCQGTGGADC